MFGSRLSTLVLAVAAGCVLTDSDGEALANIAQSDEVCPKEQLVRIATYNVAGLPQAISPGNPMRNSALISPRLNDYDLVFLQEDFAYHAEIAGATTHPYPSPPDPRALSLGDGLSFFSIYPFRDVYREAWRDCFGYLDSGSDCLTPKGFAMARFELGDGQLVDIYDLHADAGTKPGDYAARAGNLRQLASAIAERSAGNAVIVAGDLNSRYTRVDDILPELIESAALTDVWAALERDGDAPLPGDPVPCDPDDPGCERIDKILYRNGGGLRLRPVSYDVEGAKFVDPDGAQLSDHRPVAVTFAITRE